MGRTGVGDILECSCQEKKHMNKTPFSYNGIEDWFFITRMSPFGVVLRTPILESASLPPFAHGAPGSFDRLMG